MSNVNFEAIRAKMQAAVNGTAQATQAASNKVVEAIKTSATAVHGVLPASNNKVDKVEDQVAHALAALKLDIDQLRAQLGVQAQPIAVTDVQAVASALLAGWHAKEEKKAEPAPAPVAEEPRIQPAPQVVAPQPVVPQEPVAPAQKPSFELDRNIGFNAPDFQLGAQA